MPTYTTCSVWIIFSSAALNAALGGAETAGGGGLSLGDGAVFNASSTGCALHVEGNTAYGSKGGGVALAGSSVLAIGAFGGGGIMNRGMVQFLQNRAAVDGGGLALDSGSSVQLDSDCDLTVNSNTALRGIGGGAAIHSRLTNMTLSKGNATFTNNTAASGAGG